MGRNKFFYLFSEINPEKNYLEEALREFRKSLKCQVQVLSAIRKKNFDFDAWATELDKKLAEQNISVKNEPRLRLQLETFAKIFQEPKLLLDLRSPELEPLKKLIHDDKLLPSLEQAQYGCERQKIIARFMAEVPVEKLSEIFDGVEFVRPMKKFPRAQKMFKLLVEKSFFVNIPEENFLSIVDKYFIIKNERNHVDHAHEKFGEFTTIKSLREFMSDALDELKDNLKLIRTEPL